MSGKSKPIITQQPQSTLGSDIKEPNETIKSTNNQEGKDKIPKTNFSDVPNREEAIREILRSK